ncbi:MAG: hypothetical protein ACR2HH_01300 [Chthoniobacterales bacterium]
MPAKKKTITEATVAVSQKQIIGAPKGVRLTLDDTSGKRALLLETPGGHQVALNDSARTIEILDNNGNHLRLTPSGITILAAGKVTINAAEVKVSAGLITVDAGTTRFNGLVQCESLITNSVVSASYSPGAGNIW